MCSEGGTFAEGLPINEPATPIDEVWYDLDWDTSRRIGWRERTGKESFYVSSQLAELWVRRLLDHLRDRAVGNHDL